MPIITIGIDLAKNIFAVHGVNESGRAELVKPRVSRDQLLPLIANLRPCLIGWRACSGAHYWARLFRCMATPSNSWPLYNNWRSAV